MIVEKLVIDALAAALAIPVYYGAQPQPSDKEPAPLPVGIVQRPSATFLNTICGADVSLAITTIQVDIYAETMQEARTLHDEARQTMASLHETNPSVVCTSDGESSLYDVPSRAWRVTSRWFVPDYAPTV
jgi:hypothetical protein